MQQTGVLTGLSLDFSLLVVSLLNGGFETTLVRWDHEKSDVSLRSSRNHVLNEIPVSWGINDCVMIFFCKEFFGCARYRDTTGSLVFGFVHEKGKREGTLSLCVGFCLKFLELTLVNTSKFKHEMSSGGGFSCIDVSYNNNTKMLLSFLCVVSHFECDMLLKALK